MTKESFEYLKKKLEKQKELGFSIQVSRPRIDSAGYAGTGKIQTIFVDEENEIITVDIKSDYQKRDFVIPINVNRDVVRFVNEQDDK